MIGKRGRNGIASRINRPIGRRALRRYGVAYAYDIAVLRQIAAYRYRVFFAAVGYRSVIHCYSADIGFIYLPIQIKVGRSRNCVIGIAYGGNLRPVKPCVGGGVVEISAVFHGARINDCQYGGIARFKICYRRRNRSCRFVINIRTAVIPAHGYNFRRYLPSFRSVAAGGGIGIYGVIAAGRAACKSRHRIVSTGGNAAVIGINKAYVVAVINFIIIIGGRSRHISRRYPFYGFVVNKSAVAVRRGGAVNKPSVDKINELFLYNPRT